MAEATNVIAVTTYGPFLERAYLRVILETNIIVCQERR
jgi:hypothetical protein